MKFARLIVLVGLVLSGEENHRYEKDEHVVLWMNTVGPYHNRQETYEYFSLPFCKGAEHEDVGKVRHHHNIGDALQVGLAYSAPPISHRTLLNFCLFFVIVTFRALNLSIVDLT